MCRALRFLTACFAMPLNEGLHWFQRVYNRSNLTRILPAELVSWDCCWFQLGWPQIVPVQDLMSTTTQASAVSCKVALWTAAREPLPSHFPRTEDWSWKIGFHIDYLKPTYVIWYTDAVPIVPSSWPTVDPSCLCTTNITKEIFHSFISLIECFTFGKGWTDIEAFLNGKCTKYIKEFLIIDGQSYKSGNIKHCNMGSFHTP